MVSKRLPGGRKVGGNQFKRKMFLRNEIRLKGSNVFKKSAQSSV